MVQIAPFPTTLQGLSPEWLTPVLRQRGALRSSSVLSVDILSASLGNGMAAQISRIGLRYDREESGQPRTLVVKRPAVDPNLRAFYQAVGAYQREAFFYNEIAAKIQTRSPHCYFAGYTPEPPNMLLLLEDLAGYEQGNWPAGCSLKRARLILREMALLHAAWWNSPKLEEMEILVRFEQFDPAIADRDFAAQWPAAMEVLGLDDILAYRAICMGIEGKIERASRALNYRPMTLSHLDFHLDNMAFGKQPGQAPFLMLDWALLGKMNPAYDLAFFLAQNLDTPLRRAHEHELIGEYLATLAAHGVTGYTLKACLPDYRAALLPIMQRTIGAVYSLLPLTAEKAKGLRVILTRLLDTIIDNY
jgi:hypothetical protein